MNFIQFAFMLTWILEHLYFSSASKHVNLPSTSNLTKEWVKARCNV